MTTENQSNDEAAASPRWRPLEAIERRVFGVLIEKAKTTPENYPLSLNSIRTGCNQKSNRAPLMQLEEEQVEESLETLRKAGAVSQIQGGARVDKYRHLAYEWLGVEKVELAVMAELLLRGAQTVGELRGRAARMEPIRDLGELQPTLDSLQAKGLIVYLTPPGRGSVVSHALYLDRELEKVRREAGGDAPSEAGSAPLGGGRRADHRFAAVPASPQKHEAPVRHAERHSSDRSESAALADEMRRLHEELATVRQELETARSEFESTARDLRRQLDELNRQLGI